MLPAMKRWRIGLLVTGAAFACQKHDDEAAKPHEEAAKAKAASAAERAAAEAASQAVPNADDMNFTAELGPVKAPADNPPSDAKVELGRELFFDKRLSGDNSRSCYSCHRNEDGNGGKDPVAIGAGDKKLTRHSPVIWNVGYLPRLYWDGRSGSLEEQGSAAWAGGNMGVGQENLAKKAQELGKIAGYRQQFKEVFPEQGATPETIIRAISAYERTLVCDDTAFDRYAKGDKKQLTDNQKKGLELFMGKAACTACHVPPFFSTAYIVKEGAYFNVGIGFEGKKAEEVDVGRKKVSGSDADFAAFKVPTLRNVSKSAPYFHDGSQKTLEEAVRFMASGGFENAHRSPLVTDKHLTDDEVKALVEFLGSLDCQVALAEPKLP
jgi:cytochrome c peroxidase